MVRPAAAAASICVFTSVTGSLWFISVDRVSLVVGRIAQGLSAEFSRTAPVVGGLSPLPSTQCPTSMGSAASTRVVAVWTPDGESSGEQENVGTLGRRTVLEVDVVVMDMVGFF